MPRLLEIVIHGLEASHDNLEEIELVSALLADVDHALLVDEHDGLCRRKELNSDTIRIHILSWGFTFKAIY